VLFLLLLLQQVDHQAEGIKALESKQYPAAVALFEKAVAADPSDYGAHFHLGLAHSLAGDPARAAAAYRRTLELKPGLYEAELNLGQVLIDTKDFAGAVSSLESAMARKPDQFRPVYYLAHAHLAAGRPGQAEPMFRRALELDPKSDAARAGLGRALVRQAKLKDAEPVLRAVGDIDGLLELAALHEKAKDAAAAIAIYQSVPASAAIRERLGNLLIEVGKPEDAIPHLEAAVKESPTAANRYALATAYLRTKRIDQAGAAMEQALAAEPKNTDLRLAYGGLLRDQRKFDAAAKQFWQVTRERPDSKEGWSGLATMLLSMENYQQSIAAFDRLEALGDPTPGIFFLRALAYDKTKQYPQAMASYQKFLSVSSDKYPDEEFKARQRIKVIQKELSKR
jgi:tetratricopeptide (TPR) repeat protein